MLGDIFIMAFWKLLITLIITVFIVLTVLAAFPAARQVFNIGDLPNIDIGPLFSQPRPEQQAGNMSFSFSTDEYEGSVSAAVNNVSISLITNSASLQLRDGAITGKKSIVITGFSGSFVLGKENFTLDGSFNKLELTELGVTFTNSAINGSVSYWSVQTSEFYVSRIMLENATGSVSAKGAVIRVEKGDIIITGTNVSVYADRTLSINGYARSIALPKSDIEIK